MQQADLPRFTMNTKTNRFKTTPKGGATAETYCDNTSFKPTNEFFKPILKAPEEIPNGRPLWLAEINKQVPAGSYYDIESTFGNNKLIFKTRTTSFKNVQSQLNQTMR